MARKIKISFVNVTAWLAMAFIAYYILMCDNIFNSSVASIIAWSHQLSMHKHVAVLAIIPVYIGVIIFGAALLGLYFGSALQSAINARKNRTPQES